MVGPSRETASKRTSLKWIQPSVDENGLTRSTPATQLGKKRLRDVDVRNEKMTKKAKLQPRLMLHPPTGSVTVYSDRPPTPPSHKTPSQGVKCTCGCHTRSKDVPQEETTREEQEAYDLMVKEEVSPGYWKVLAERRRAALEETLTENRQLHKQVEELTQQNDQLSLLASQAEYLASALNMLTEETASSTKKTEDEGEKDTEDEGEKDTEDEGETDTEEDHADDFTEKDVTKEEDNNTT